MLDNRLRVRFPLLQLWLALVQAALPPGHRPNRRRAKLEQELQAYGSQLSEEQRRAALAEHEMREREYSRLQVRPGWGMAGQPG